MEHNFNPGLKLIDLSGTRPWLSLFLSLLNNYLLEGVKSLLLKLEMENFCINIFQVTQSTTFQCLIFTLNLKPFPFQLLLNL